MTKYFIIFVVFLLISLKLYFGFTLQSIYIPATFVSNKKDLPSIIDINQAPYQRDIYYKNEIARRYGYHIKEQAFYSVTARVLSIKSYTMNAQGDLAPLDFVLGWKGMAKQSALSHITISQSGRFYLWQADPSVPLSLTEIAQSSANTHLIPADSGILRSLEMVHTGQIVACAAILSM